MENKVRIKMFLTFTFLLLNYLTFGQSKKETIDWLNSKFPENPFVYGSFLMETRQMKISADGTFSIKVLIHQQPLGSSPIAETTTFLSGNLKDFSLSSVKVLEEEKGLFLIMLTCVNSKECVTVRQIGKPGVNYDKKGVAFGAFKHDEENISERLVKGFKHLITVSGGKKETF